MQPYPSEAALDYFPRNAPLCGASCSNFIQNRCPYFWSIWLITSTQRSNAALYFATHNISSIGDSSISSISCPRFRAVLFVFLCLLSSDEDRIDKPNLFGCDFQCIQKGLGFLFEFHIFFVCASYCCFQIESFLRKPVFFQTLVVSIGDNAIDRIAFVCRIHPVSA